MQNDYQALSFYIINNLCLLVFAPLLVATAYGISEIDFNLTDYLLSLVSFGFAGGETDLLKQLVSAYFFITNSMFGYWIYKTVRGY